MAFLVSPRLGENVLLVGEKYADSGITWWVLGWVLEALLG